MTYAGENSTSGIMIYVEDGTPDVIEPGLPGQVLQVADNGGFEFSYITTSGVNSSDIFNGLHTSGGVNVDAGWTDIPLESEIIKDAGYTHLASSASVQILNGGRYRFASIISTDISSGTSRSVSEGRIVIDSGTGFSTLAGPNELNNYNRTVNQGEESLTIYTIADIPALSTVKTQARRLNGTSNIVTLANKCSLTIEYADTVGAQGEAGPSGAQGPQGDMGPSGLQGLQGIQGVQGETGPSGAPGLDGQSVQVSISGSPIFVATEDINFTGLVDVSPTASGVNVAILGDGGGSAAVPGASGSIVTTDGVGNLIASSANVDSSGTITMPGGQIVNGVITSAPSYSIQQTDWLIISTATVARTITLPASPETWQYHNVKDGAGNASSKKITVDGNGNNIDGDIAVIINGKYTCLSFIFNGTEWNIV